MPSSNQAWLDQVQEEPLEPALPICDPHHHLWDFKIDREQPRYFLEDMLEDIASGHNVVSTVFIECGAFFRADGAEELRPIGETEFVNGEAARAASGQYGPCRLAAGIVGTADLCLGAGVADVLDAQVAAGNGRFRGIRLGAPQHDHPEVPNHRTNPIPNLYADPTFREGFAQLAPRQMSFEAWCYHTQLPGLIDLARAFPETTIVLDHLGGPLGIGPFAGKQDAVFESWKPLVTELASCPNVVAKVGGLNMTVNGFGWEKRPLPPTSEELMQATRRWYEHLIAAFGVNRCMFESNFPVDKVSCSYGVLWNSFKRLAAGYSDDEKAALFHDTAARVYRLSGSSSSSAS